jgi:hypothetical protein
MIFTHTFQGLIESRGRAISYQLIDGANGGIAYTWSSLASQPEFLAGSMPMPIVTSIERAPNNREQLIGKSSKGSNLISKVLIL